MNQYKFANTNLPQPKYTEPTRCVLRGKDKLDLLEDDLIELIDQKEEISIEAMPRYFICNSPCRHISIVKDTKKFKTF